MRQSRSAKLGTTDDPCPPVANSTDPSIQPASCALGCNSKGTCHSHNVFGECTHQLTWNLAPKFGDAPVSGVIVFKGDKIEFQGSGSAHNLFEFASKEPLDQCDFTDAAAIANVEEVFVGKTLTFDEEGTFYFSCGIGCTGFPTEGDVDASARQEPGNNFEQCHCTIGQKLTVQVKDSSEALRCHDHAPISNEKVDDLSCTGGQVPVYVIDNPAYGAMDANECAEFCTRPEALSFMVGVKEGSCADAGFASGATETTVTVPSGQDIIVHVKRKEEPSTCHCHSYEMIPCVADETPEDALYDEHIDKIETFCAGILDGTEEDCPYFCFQPMEVLHLHYLECPLREVNPSYRAVNTTAKCHIAASAPAGTDCPVVSLGGEPEPPTPPLPESFQLAPVRFHGCIETSGHDKDDKLFLEECHSGKTTQQWEYDGLTGLMRTVLGDGTYKCMQAGHTKMPPEDGGKVQIFACDATDALQQFDWPSALGSPLALKMYPEYCVIFRGGTAELGVDPIIVKECIKLEKTRRDRWMAK